jgi:hypothetical protein
VVETAAEDGPAPEALPAITDEATAIDATHALLEVDDR